MFEDSYCELLEILQNDYNSFKFNFEIIKATELKPIKFLEYPIWSEFYDYEELEEIANWGFNKIVVQQKMKVMEINQQHPYYTVPISKFPINRIRYFTKSKFKTKSNLELSGYIMNEGEFGIGIFMGEEEELFTKQSLIGNDHIECLRRISQFYEYDISDLDELKYETEIPFDKEKRIRGTFKLIN